MNIHQNAKLTPQSRAAVVRRILDQGQTPKAVASAFGVCARTVRKWVARYRAEGADGLLDRSSRPHRSPRSIPATLISRITALRRLRWTGAQIAATVGVAPATVSRVLRRQGLARLSALDPPLPVRRYEHPHPGDLLHLDIKKLGRFRRPGHRVTGDRRHSSPGAGWEYLHVCVDDHSRLAFSQLYPDQTAATAAAFLTAALDYYHRLGIRVRRVLTDNGGCYRSRAFHARCAQRGYAIASPGPSPLLPTAKPNASSRPRYVSGPTPTPITPPPSVPNTSDTGSTATIGTAHTLVLKPTRPSVESV